MRSCCHWLQLQPRVAVEVQLLCPREAGVSEEQHCALSVQKDTGAQFKWWSWLSECLAGRKLLLFADQPFSNGFYGGWGTFESYR